jgi:hypothetical protein
MEEKSFPIAKYLIPVTRCVRGLIVDKALRNGGKELAG